jgi:MoaA/NifB/PqqE/SkfB family radical SAM enzyme
MLTDTFKSFSRKSWRLRRHLAAAWKYQTPRRLWNLLRVEAERLAGREVVKGRPYILIVDPLNVCNLKCPLCPTGTGDLPMKPGKMKVDQFKSLIDEVAPHTFKLMMYNWGEPFIHKGILEMIGHAHSRRIATAVSSNLNVLPDGGGEAVVRSGLDDLIVSCDGITPDIYEKYRRGGKLENVTRNLREIADARRRLRSSTPRIEFQFLVFRHNEHQASQVEAFARGLGADFVRLTSPYVDEASDEFQTAVNPEFVRSVYAGREKGAPLASHKEDNFHAEGDADLCAKKNPPPLKCFWPWRSMVINWNGQVDPCCFKNYRESFGNVFESGFEEVWNGPVYRYSRRWILGTATGAPAQSVVCRGCGGYK